MITVYQTGSLAAQLSIAAISALHGGIIRQGLTWAVTRLDEQEQQTDEIERSEQARTQFHLKPGHYRVTVTFQDDDIHCGNLTLEQNTLTDCVFILKNTDLFDEEAEYFAETDPHIEHARRIEDRNIESRLGHIETPLKNPYQEQGQGSPFQAHPLLSQKAQFDGMPPEINVDPQKNEAAMEKQLQLQLQMQLQNQQNHNMTPPKPV